MDTKQSYQTLFEYRKYLQQEKSKPENN